MNNRIFTVEILSSICHPESTARSASPPRGYRTFSFKDNHGDDAVVPSALTDGVTTTTDLLLDALQPIVGEAIFDPDHPVGAFFAPDAVDRLIEADPSLEPWVRIALALAGPDEDPPAQTVRFGIKPSQASLSSSTGGEEAS